MQDIHDIEPPVPVGMDPFLIQMLMILAGILAIVGLGLLLFFYLKRRRQHRLSQNTLMLPPPLPPDQTAMHALDALEDAMKKDPRQYYFDISAILKIFMGKVFDMGVPEMTTREVLATLSGLALDKDLTARTRNFFEFAAMVKYAGITPDVPSIRKDTDLVRDFIRFVTVRSATSMEENSNRNPVAMNSAKAQRSTGPDIPLKDRTSDNFIPGSQNPVTKDNRSYIPKGQ